METIADKSRTKEIIERLQAIMDSASPVPLASGKVMIYKDEVQSLLSELASQIDMEIKTYHEVNDRKGKIINEAKKEAERIIFLAEHTASRVRVNKRTTNVDPVDFSMLTQEELDALDNANEIYGASLIYTDEMLTEVSNLVTETYENLKNDYEIVLEALEEKINTLAENRTELMNGLQEMDGKDRSQQILEIGQLLSNELFNARMNSHANPDMYDDGSVQLTFDLKTEQELMAKEAEENAKQAYEAAAEASEAVKEAEAALAEMTAERDALMAEVNKMQEENRAAEAARSEATAKFYERVASRRKASREKSEIDKSVEEAAVKEAQDRLRKQKADAQNENTASGDEEDEYEIVYVDEDELEEGEEYEVVYVDEDDNEYEPEKAREFEVVTGDEENGAVPMIPHFTKSQKIASVPSEKVAKMANAIINDKKHSGLISRAVEEREKAEKEEAVKVVSDEFEIMEF